MGKKNFWTKTIRRYFQEFIELGLDETGFTNESLAEKSGSGVDVTTIRRYLLEEFLERPNPPREGTYKAVFSAFGKTHEDFLKFVESKKGGTNEPPSSDNSACDTSQNHHHQPEHDSHEILCAKFCYPLQFGKLIRGAINSDSENDNNLNYLFEFPLCWQENSEHVSLKCFELENQEDVLNQWGTEAEGVFLILGEPGGGKTTVLRHWRYQFNSHRIVKYVALRDQGCIPTQTSENKKTTVWLLDGWDEIPPERRSLDTVNRLPGIKIISCRTVSYHDELALSDDNIRYLMGMLPREQRLFLTNFAKSLHGSRDSFHVRIGLSNADESWCERTWCSIQSQPTVRALAGSPLLLVLFAYIYAPKSSNKSVEINSRNQFYERAYDQLCEQRHPVNTNKQSFRITKLLLIELARLINRSLHFEEESLVIAFETLQQPRTDFTYPELVKIATTSEIVRKFGAFDYEFLHLTFQEWFLAHALLENGLVKTTKEHWSDSNFTEVLAMMWAKGTSKERVQATNYLTKQNSMKPGEDGRFVKKSGLNTALTLWHRSGIDLKTEEVIIKSLLTQCTKSKSKKIGLTSISSTPPLCNEIPRQ